MSFKQFLKDLNNNEAEGELVKTIGYSIIASTLMLALLYLVKLREITDLFPGNVAVVPLLVIYFTYYLHKIYRGIF